MMRLVRLPLAVTAITLLVACHGDRTVTPDIGTPSAAISDGAHSSGNPDFFFLPPMVPNPSGLTDFEAGEFNAELAPAVQICEGTGATGTACDGAEVALFTMTSGPGSTVRLSEADEHYIVNWHTDQFNLDPALTYRIRVLVGTNVLGFADVELGASRSELKNINTNEFIPLLDGRTLPIKFRIEEGALCQGNDTCSSETIVLRDGGSVVLEETGDRVDIPAQNSDRIITVTLQLCNREGGIQVDLRKFGNCLTVTSDPPLGESFSFSPPATVSMCSVLTDPAAVADLATLTEEQEDLVTMHRQDDGDVFALPHGGQFCTSQINRGPSNPLGQLVRALGELFAPRPLHAATTVLDVGPSGETDFFSDFQLALPAKMEALNETDACDVEGVIDEPAVCVTDARGAPVNGATVHFEVDPGEGGVFTVHVVTGAEGAAGVAQLGEEVSFVSVRAWGMGIADPTTNGPQSDVFDPFWPDFSVAAVADMVVPVDIGEVVFTATPAQPTTTALVSAVPLAGVGFTVPLEATVTPAPPVGSIVEFFEGATSLGTALTNEAGSATRSVTLNGVLARQFFTARFTGTTSHGASTSPVAVQQKWQHFDDPASFTAALGGAVTETQDFEGLDLGTTVSAVIGSVLNVTSSFPTLGVFECTTKCLFGAGGDVRLLGNGQYDLVFLPPRNAIAFDLASQDPATGPASIQIFAGLTGITIGERNLGADESTPNFFGIILTVPIQRVLVLEGPEVGGSGNEEIGLDNFIIASVPFSP